MYKLPLEKVKEIITKEISIEELELRIKRKMEELAGLISEEGAAHIIANEQGIKLYEQSQSLKIKDLQPGMRNIKITGKITRLFEIRHFQTEKRTGKVGSFFIADETGQLRVTLWNDQADLLKKIKENDIVKIESAYVRENRGWKEIHVNDQAKITINPQGITIGEIKQKQETIRKKINELTEQDQNVEILGTIVQVFDPRYFVVCSQCNKKVQQQEDGYYCVIHQKVEPTHSYVLNVIIDDGTETIRTVLWKSQTEQFLKKTNEEILKYKDKPEEFSHVKTDMLGEQVRITGKVTKNEMFQRLELSAQQIQEANPEKELAKLEA